MPHISQRPLFKVIQFKINEYHVILSVDSILILIRTNSVSIQPSLLHLNARKLWVGIFPTIHLV